MATCPCGSSPIPRDLDQYLALEKQVANIYWHFPSTPWYPEPAVLQILPLCFHEHAFSLMRHLYNWGASLISCVCSAFMIQQIARKRKPSWVMLCNFEYLESRWYFSQYQLQFCKCFPVAMVKALWSKSSQREAGSPLFLKALHRGCPPNGPSKGPHLW